MTAPSSTREGGKVVDIEETSPAKAVADSESGNGCSDRIWLLEHTDESIALRSLHLVDQSDELRLIPQVGAKFTHRLECEAGL